MTDRHFTVRLRRDADLPLLAAVLVRVHAVDGYPVEGVADPDAWLHHSQELRSWTADDSGQRVGQIMLTNATAEDDAARLWCTKTGGDIANLVIPIRLFVDPDHRRAGAAQLLMAAAVGHAQELGRTIAFDVMAKDRAAIRLYEHLGARRIGEITHHHSDGLTEPAFVYVV